MATKSGIKNLLNGTGFRRGGSGNPKGRPKKALNFDDELIKESKSPVTVNENGRPKRITKHNVVVKQLLKQAMTGNIHAARLYLDHYHRVLEKTTLAVAQQASAPLEDKAAIEMTDEELLWVARGGLEKLSQQSKKEQISNTE